MKWASAVSRRPELEAALDEVIGCLQDELGGAVPDLAVAFVSAHHAGAYGSLPGRVATRLAPGALVGCSGGGVIGGGREVEDEPGVSLTAALLPRVAVEAFHLEDAASAGGEPAELPAVLAERDRPHFVLLADPFTFDTEGFLPFLDRRFPEARKVGGLASGGRRPGESVLYCGDEIHRAGLVGVVLDGDVEIETIVAQGCRPIGDPMFVTRAQGNLIYGLDGRSPIEILEELYGRLAERDRELLRHSLFLGVVMKESAGVYRQGDFLIRNLLGVDTAKAALAVGALIGEGAIVQFHLRDAETSAADLEQLLGRRSREARARPSGSLLFSCLGRGRHLYGRPDHDTDAFRRHLGDVPLGGFFCNGEIGPVGGTTFLHGYTSSFGLFRPRRAA